jgi:hypothetical protein
MTVPPFVAMCRALRNRDKRALLTAIAVAVLVLGVRVTTLETPTNDELDKRLTQLETAARQKADARTPAPLPPPYQWVAWLIFGAVGVAFAIAWARVNGDRETTRRQELEGQKAARLIEAGTAQTKALADLVRILDPKAQDPKMRDPKTTLELVARILKQTAEQTADYINKMNP